MSTPNQIPLTNASPLRQVFTDGLLPVKSPLAVAARLGDSIDTSLVYFLDTAALTPEKGEAFAALMAAARGCPIEAARDAVATGVIPIRATNCKPLGVSLRYFT